jgi:predicted  nucleic acid-binding Zn-ribbon protein
MLPDIEKLLVLQDRDRKIRSLKQEVKHGPLERKQLEEKLVGSQKHLETVKTKAMELEVERKKLENEVQSKRDQIAKYQVQKFGTRKNEEFAAFTTAIQHLEAEILKVEDRELELMEAAEVLKPQIAEANKNAQATKTSVESQTIHLDGKLKAIEQQIKEVEADRTRLAADVSEDLLDTYQRLFLTKGDAVVAIEHEVCTGCHMKVTASTNASARAGRSVVHCEQCGRIVYYNNYQ